MSSSYPFSIDVQVYNQTTNNYYTQRVGWVSTPLLNQVEGDMIVQYLDNGPTKAGLYFMGLSSFRICVFYKEIEDLVIQGGSVKLYYNLQTNIAVEPLSAIYLNGYKKDVTSLTPNPGIWTVMRFGDTDVQPGGDVQSVNGKTGVVLLTTTDIPEGTNLYYTGQRVAADAPVKSVNTKTGVVALTTTDVPQGTNLYYTDALAKAAAPVQKVAGRIGDVVLAVADVSGAAPLLSPSFTGTPEALNPAWPVAYDAPNPNGGGYLPGGVSVLATRDVLKAAVAGALGNFSGINVIDETLTMIPPLSNGALWIIAFATQGQNCTLPDLSAVNYVDPAAANGLTFNFANISKYPVTLFTGQNKTDQIFWGGNQILDQVVVNPGETLSLTIVWWNRVLVWIVSGGSALPQASNSYTVELTSGHTSYVPSAAMSKAQIVMTGALTQVLDTNLAVIPTVLSLPTEGEFTLVNRTTGNQPIYITNTSVTSEQTITLIANTNAHVVTGDYGVLSASNAISGAFTLYVPTSAPSINLFYAALLYDVLVITDNPAGNMTVDVTYVFDPAFAKVAGNWVFYNDLKQANPKTVTIADTFGNSVLLPVGTAKTILYTPDFKIVVT